MDLKSLAATRLAGRPWAIAPGRLEGLLGSALALTPGAELPSWLQEATRRQGYTVIPGSSPGTGGIAIVPVLGPLVARGDWLTLLLGATEYGAVAEAVSAAADDPAVRGILLELDSPGGEVGGLFDLVEEVAAIKARSGKPLWAVASEAALSAAYAIASAADRLYVTRTGEVGSVGVVAVHLDASGADAMAGLQWTLIHAGARKTDGNPHQPLSPQAAAGIQADVDRLYDDLVALVARNRKRGADAVRAGDAAIWRGERAIAAGFADGIGTVAQVAGELSASLEPKRLRSAAPSPARQPPKGASLMTEVATDTTAPDARTPVMPSTPIGDPAATAAVPPYGTRPAAGRDDAHAIAETLRAEYAEIATIAAQAGRLGIDLDAADAMRRGLRPDAMRRSVLDQLAARAEAADVVAAAPAPATPGDSPIVRRARERAAASSR